MLAKTFLSLVIISFLKATNSNDATNLDLTEAIDSNTPNYESNVDLSANLTVNEGRISKILVFGGNGLIGHATVARLLRLPIRPSITLVNRGNWYWDSGTEIKPFVHAVFSCDRAQPLEECLSFVDHMSSSSIYYDFVIDFSVIEPETIQDTLGFLKNIYVGLYIYISSDSVYEVIIKETSERPTAESDAIRPKDEQVSKRLIEKDTYGDAKLGCEETLARHRASGGPPFIAIRIPDVIGPRDNTYRFWMTHIMLNLHTFLMKPLIIPGSDHKMSFVYSEDIASFIYEIVNAPDVSFAFDQAFNLAWPQSFSFEDLYTSIASHLPIGKPFKLDVKPDWDRDLHFYPSVTQGPIDISKAMTYFRWQPTEWSKAIGTSVEFYKHIGWDIRKIGLVPGKLS